MEDDGEVVYSGGPGLDDGDGDFVEGMPEEQGVEEDAMPPMVMGVPPTTTIFVRPSGKKSKKGFEDGSAPKNLYVYTVAAGNGAKSYMKKAFIRVPPHSRTGSTLYFNSDFDEPSKRLLDQVVADREQRQVRMTNVAHHTRNIVTSVDFNFTIRDILCGLAGAADVALATTLTEVCVFHTAATMIPLEHAFDMGAAETGAAEDASSSCESDYENGHPKRDYSRLVYSDVVDAETASQALMQTSVPGVQMGKIMLTSVSLRGCDTQFPIPLKVTMVGVVDNFHAKYGPCAARISSNGSVMTVLDGGKLMLVQPMCSERELASFMDMDPDREVQYVLQHGADAARAGRYHLTPKLMLFVETYLVRLYAARCQSRKAAVTKLKSKGVTVGMTGDVLMVHVTCDGLMFILGQARKLRARMPIFKPEEVMIRIEPDIPGGWRGMQQLLASDRMAMFAPHESLDFQDIPFQVTVHLDMMVVPPDAQHERVEAFAGIVNAYVQRKATASAGATASTGAGATATASASVVYTPPAPQLSAEYLALQQQDPLSAAILMASGGATTTTVTASASASSKRSAKRGKDKARRK